ncbi:transposase, IS5 family [Nitrosospira multiformis]|uniref:Transposase, IS5 family n=1 Tax=Nitrosospira multiformis TaxID=1231 RepID=A0A1I0EU97_9PROT|nr:transposase, IS5 family [Nitrosospira multiformis]
MWDLFYLSETQFNRIKPYFPLSHGVLRINDLRVISGIMYVIRNGLQRKNAPHQTLYNRFVRWSRLGVFNRIFAELAGKEEKAEQLMIDATHLKAHRTAASLLKKGMFPAVSVARRAA